MPAPHPWQPRPWQPRPALWKSASVAFVVRRKLEISAHFRQIRRPAPRMSSGAPTATAFTRSGSATAAATVQTTRTSAVSLPAKWLPSELCDLVFKALSCVFVARFVFVRERVRVCITFSRVYACVTCSRRCCLCVTFSWAVYFHFFVRDLRVTNQRRLSHWTVDISPFQIIVSGRFAQTSVSQATGVAATAPGVSRTAANATTSRTAPTARTRPSEIPAVSILCLRKKFELETLSRSIQFASILQPSHRTKKKKLAKLQPIPEH